MNRMEQKNVNVVALQLSLSKSRDERIKWIWDQVDEIEKSNQKIDFLILPELWLCGFFAFEDYHKMAELRSDSQTISIAKTISRKLNCYTISGSFVEKNEQNYYNTTAVISPEGEVLATYQKIHLFGYNSAETELLTAGDHITTVDTKFGKLGLATCYDLRFPELFRAMIAQEIELIFIVSAWPAARTEHWRLLNQVRAIENQSFLIACNCAGTQEGVKLAGHSIVMSPDGVILAEADEEESCLIAEIALADVKNARDNFPALHDRSELFWKH